MSARDYANLSSANWLRYGDLRPVEVRSVIVAVVNIDRILTCSFAFDFDFSRRLD